MESEVNSPSISRALVKCCDCDCTTCSLIGESSGAWFRSVKRKYDEYETGDKFYVPDFDLNSNAKVQIENECVALREMISSQQAAIQDLYVELEEERNASSSAATEAMSMILKLQREKAEIQMEARQFKCFAEEKMAHDQEEMMVLDDLLYKGEQAIEALTFETQAYKHRMMSYGLTEAEVDGEPEGLIRNVVGNFGDSDDLPFDYPPPKCYLNENHGDDVEKYAFGETPFETQAYKHRMMSYGLTEAEVDGEPEGLIRNVVGNFGDSDDLPFDYPPPKCYLNENHGDDVEKYAFGETPCAREQLRNLEERIGQMERKPSSSQLSQLDGYFPGTKNVSEKVIVGHSPRKPTHSRGHSSDSSTSFLAKEINPEFTSDSPRFNTSFNKTGFVSETDKISTSRRMDNASEIGDDISDRVYTVDYVHTGVPCKGIPEPTHEVGGCDDYASTPRDALNLPDVCDPDIKKLYVRLQALEADRESMRQAIISMRTDKVQLVLLKEIAQNLCKEMPTERQVAVRKPYILQSLPFMSFFKWVASFVFRKRRACRNKYLYGLSPSNVGLLMLLDKGPRLRQWRCLSSTEV